MASSFKRQFEDSNGGDQFAKRSRHARPPTRVVFVRNLPDDCLESELLALCCPFAVVEKSVMVPHKCQAFVQLADVASATNLIAFYQSRDALIRGKKVFFDHADREEINVRPSHEGASGRQPVPFSTSAAPAATVPPPQYQQQQQPPPQYQQQPPSQYQQQPPPQYQQQQLPPQYQQQPPQYQQVEQEPYDARGPPPSASSYRNDPLAQFQDPPGSMFRRGGGGQPNTILMVAVTKIEYDVTVDVLHQVFQKFGNVKKIVTFWKNDEFKALVEMESIPQAQAAQAALDGRDIYTGCNQLGIVFSRHTELHVRYNSERSRDFMNPNLPTGPEPGDAGGDLHGYDHDEPHGLPSNVPPPRGMDRGGRDEQEYGRQPNGGPGRRDSFDSREPSRGQGGGYDREVQYSRYGGRGPPPDRFDRDQRDPRDEHDQRDQREFNNAPASIAGPLPSHSTGRSLRTESSLSSVLICSNMDRELVNPVRLFTFFGCFGDVLRVKIMFRKQDTALIQFADDVHATSALDHLDGVDVFGRKLRVDYSKHTTVSMPRGEVDRFELDNTRDFTNSPLHRYRHRSPQDAAPPSPLLHIAGIPRELQRNQSALIDLFAQYGFVKNFHYIQKNSHMALIEMGSLDEAVMALVSIDDLAYPDSHLRVSFSKGLQFADAAGGGPMQSGPMPSGPMPSGPMHPPRDRSRDRSRERPMRTDRYGGGGGMDNRNRGFPRENRGRSGDQFRRPPPQRY